MSEYPKEQIQALLDNYLRNKLDELENERIKALSSPVQPTSQEDESVDLTEDQLRKLAALVDEREDVREEPTFDEKRIGQLEGNYARLEAIQFLKEQLKEALIVNDPESIDEALKYYCKQDDVEFFFDSIQDSFFKFVEKSGLEAIPGTHEYSRLWIDYTKTLITLYEIVERRLTGDYNYEKGILGSIPVMPLEKEPSIKLSELIEQYQKAVISQLKPKSQKDKTGRLKTIVFILGDISLDQITHPTIDDFRDKLQKLPPGRNKAKKYKGKSLDELLAMKPQKTIGTDTVNNILSELSALFNFAVKRDLLKKNYAEGYKIKVPKADSRQPFSIDDLNTIFNSPEYKNDSFKEPNKFWLPLLALYTGARREELCQLKVGDIKPLDDVWVIDINELAEDKSVKNESSVRIIPIHKDLIKLGFIEFYKQCKKERKDRIFQELKADETGKYGDKFGKWFSKFKRKNGITDQKKVFHSFRRSFVTTAKWLDIDKHVIAQIAGHSTANDMTYGVYGEQLKPNHLKQHIDKIDFGIDLSHLLKSKFAKTPKKGK